MPSASVRSSLPCSKARRVNSPGSASRQKPSRPDRLESSADHGAAAMQMQLGHHLAGLAVGRLEPHHQAAVDRLAAHRIERVRSAMRRGSGSAGSRAEWPRAKARGSVRKTSASGARGPLRRMTESAPGCARDGARRAERIDRGVVHQVRFCGAGGGPASAAARAAGGPSPCRRSFRRATRGSAAARPARSWPGTAAPG